MSVLIVVNDPKKWPFDIPGVDVVDARSYLTKPEFSERRNVKVFNLCRSYAYQSTGYYVSLLAQARGHKPLPSISSLQDMKSQAIVRLVSEPIEAEAYALERATCVDTTAAGGNASLLAAAE